MLVAMHNRLGDNKMAIIRLVVMSMLLLVVAFFQYKLLTYSMAQGIQESIYEVKRHKMHDVIDDFIKNIESYRADYILMHPGASDEEIRAYCLQTLKIHINNGVYEDTSRPWVMELQKDETHNNYAQVLLANDDRDFGGAVTFVPVDTTFQFRLNQSDLDRVMEEGELFRYTGEDVFLYGNDIQKIGYTKVYDRYDWLISLEAHMDDMDVYVDKAEERVLPYIVGGTVILELILISMFSFLYVSQGAQHASEKDSMQRVMDSDFLTKVYSRRAGEAVLKSLFTRYKKGEGNTLIMMGDIDHFKGVNDTYGHDVGDMALKAFTGAIRAVIRDGDFLVRWGGDEFVCIFRGTAVDNIEVVSEKLMNAIHAIKIDTSQGPLQITSSMGFTTFIESDGDVDDTMRRVDEALYEAKKTGRDRYVSF